MDNPKFPEEIQCRITDEFLTTFKNCLEIIFDKELINLHKQPTYWNFYQWFDCTAGFIKALETTCEIHKFVELYDYLQGLNYYDSDILESRITEMLYKRGLVKEGNVNESMPCPFKHKNS